MIKLKNPYLHVGIYTANFEKLVDWYKNVLGFEEKERLDHPQDTYVSFKFGDNFFWIGKHGQVSQNQKNTDPYRVMVGFSAESVNAIYDELKSKQIEFVATPFEAPPGGFWCMTIKDPDGNILQFMGDK
ncbi:hypothetical protein A3C23_00950 [Candidatus Roizmanbacteria bacterium RIFCSPHIGHO2_02_FULL_37_13b]|uniref:VOC domain-containing protein n=1 Tax=Candidatus Roizmanbacteria bacterium RIFCSPLOWO2_02_FULL_36_11 TaxID=1802071 RepID=A0A1F7JIU2_9BACT|nr:MAG: hypothetical protein A3C23_00950 [Candidatus Roizmanbacteria bacterium RIFCSPHIGHO2_02_FULL_37_13b]OGK55538.1 MAG: hypothetical protein A3H78_05235 [Candidatus Roizmanbacteria bacterium RIFCSPLOWO2_02_FULL_36_11]